MKNVLSLALVALILVACGGNDDSSNTSEADLKLVTGIFVRASEFGPSIQLGNPNVIEGNYTMYPNPAIGVLSIQSSSIITHVLFIKGNPQKRYQDTDFSTILNSNLYTELSISDASELSFKELNENNLNVNLENLNFGYYKVFIKVNDEIFWNNVYIGNDKDIDELINFWK